MFSFTVTEHNILGLGFSVNHLKQRQDMQPPYVRKESDAPPFIETIVITQNTKHRKTLSTNILVLLATVKHICIYVELNEANSAYT